MKYLLLSHFGIINKSIHLGSISNWVTFFKKKNAYFILHEISGKSPSLHSNSKDNYLFKNKNIFPLNISAPFSYVMDILHNFIYLIKLRPEKIIAVDPLNAFSGFIYKLLFKNIQLFFFIPDYSEVRFKNVLLNNVYFWMLKISIEYSNLVYVVSDRTKKALEDRFNVEREKVAVVPNYPYIGFDLNEIKKEFRNKNQINIVLSAYFDDKFIFKELCIAMSKLENYSFNLNLVGDGPDKNNIENEIQKILTNKDSYSFVGYKTGKDLFHYYVNSDIGLALYSGSASYNYFGDSTKIREYLLSELPFITTNTHATCDDIKKHGLGVIIDDCTVNNLEKSILDIIKNKNVYLSNIYTYNLSSTKFENTIIEIMK